MILASIPAAIDPIICSWNSSPPPAAPCCIPSPVPRLSAPSPAVANVHATPRTAFPVPDQSLPRTSNRPRPRLPPDRLQSQTPVPAASATRSSPAHCRASRTVPPTLAAPAPPTPGRTRILPTPGSTTPGPRQIPAPPAHAVTPIVSGAMRSVPFSARAAPPVPSLLPSVARNSPPVQARTLLQTTTEKSAAYIPYPPPAATLRRKVRPPRSASTPAQCRRPAPLPPATTPAPHLPLVPTAKPPSNADSGSSAPAPHSLPPMPDSTRCPIAETPSAAYSGTKFADAPSASSPASSPRTAAQSEKCALPILCPASLACSACPAA